MYLIKVIEPFKGLKKGHEVIVRESLVRTFWNKLKIIKEIKEVPNMVKK